MSYSFIVRAEDKASAKDMISAELAKVVAAQPIHAADRAQAQRVAEIFIDLLPDEEGTTVQVNVHGSLSWTGPAELPHVVGVSFGISASLAIKEPDDE